MGSPCKVCSQGLGLLGRMAWPKRENPSFWSLTSYRWGLISLRRNISFLEAERKNVLSLLPAKYLYLQRRRGKVETNQWKCPAFCLGMPGPDLSVQAYKGVCLCLLLSVTWDISWGCQSKVWMPLTSNGLWRREKVEGLEFIRFAIKIFFWGVNFLLFFYLHPHPFALDVFHSGKGLATYIVLYAVNCSHMNYSHCVRNYSHGA